MKILFVIDSLGAGGAERSLSEMLPILKQYGFSLHVICLHSRKEGYEQEVREAGFDVEIVNANTSVGRMGALRRLFIKHRPDLIHTTLYESDILGRISSLWLGVPVTCSVVNTSYDPIRLKDARISPTKLWLAKMLDRITAHCFCQSIHAVSQAVKTAAQRDLRLDESLISVIERGRDMEGSYSSRLKRRASMRQSLGLLPSDVMLLNVGRQEYQKGQLNLLSAFENAASVNVDLRLFLAGKSGNASEELHAAWKSSKCLDRIKILGHRSDVADLLAAADVFVLTSLFEGIPGAVLEAMGMALPIIATDIPPIRELITNENYVCIVSCENMSGLSRAMCRLATDPALRYTMGACGRTAYLNNYTLNYSVARMAIFFENAAKQ